MAIAVNFRSNQKASTPPKNYTLRKEMPQYNPIHMSFEQIGNSLLCNNKHYYNEYELAELDRYLKSIFQEEIFDVKINQIKAITVYFKNGNSITIFNVLETIESRGLNYINTKLRTYIHRKNMEKYIEKFGNFLKSKWSVLAATGVVLSATFLFTHFQKETVDKDAYLTVLPDNNVETNFEYTPSTILQEIQEIPIEIKIEENIDGNITNADIISETSTMTEEEEQKVISGERKATDENYKSIAESYCKTYGLNYDYIGGIISTESSGRINIPESPAVGPMQVEKTNAGNVITAYNHDIKNWETLLITNNQMSEEEKNQRILKWNTANPNRPVIGEISIDDAKNNNKIAIKLGVMFAASNFEESRRLTGDFNPYIAAFCYNQGASTARKIIEYSGGVENIDSLDFLKPENIRAVTDDGGIKYVEKVLNHMIGDKIEYTDRYGEVHTFIVNPNFMIEETISKAM